MVTVSALLIVCALIAMIAHVLRPAIPLWITTLFIIVVLLLSVLPIK